MSEARSLERIGVIGAGQMGSGIAQVAARSGFPVWLADQTQSQADRGRQGIADQLAKLVTKGKLTADDRDATLSRIQTVSDPQDLGSTEIGLDLIIEAVSETPSLKFAVFEQLDRVCAPEVILASNTSSISITEIAFKTRRPDRVAGMHFMNPVPLMKLVEGIRGLTTSDETFRAIRKCAERMGKTFVEVRDAPGFCVNRLLMPMINEAVFALQEGLASAQDIDLAMTLGANHPMGPLTLADLIGLDTCLAIMETLHHGFGDPKYRPCPLLKQYVIAGKLGRKAGEGFYRYGS